MERYYTLHYVKERYQYAYEHPNGLFILGLGESPREVQGSLQGHLGLGYWLISLNRDGVVQL
jgi:hypothetical protein